MEDCSCPASIIFDLDLLQLLPIEGGWVDWGIRAEEKVRVPRAVVNVFVAVLDFHLLAGSGIHVF